jgi:hypothetical protein
MIVAAEYNKPMLSDSASIGLEKQASKRLPCGKLGRYKPPPTGCDL